MENTKLSLLFYSSFIFLINVFVSTYYKYYIYAILFFILFVTSLIVHSNCNIYTNLIDKFAIALVVLYGGYIFFNKIVEKYETINSIKLPLIIVIFCTFLATIYLYCYGYFCNNYCFCEDSENACKWHSLMHFIGSFGHICIVLL
jgi:hypothetical protein